MIEWTPSAKAELERYFSEVRQRLKGSGADETEVVDDLRRHIDQEIAAAKLQAVTSDGVRRILSRIGAPEWEGLADTVVSQAELPKPIAPQPPAESLGFGFLLASVILPLIAIIVEITTRSCANLLFDPIPSLWHLGAVLAVPLLNYSVWWTVRHQRVDLRKRLGWANGAVIGIAAFYTLLFIPVTLIGIIGVLFFGIGLLPLAPVISLCGAIAARRRLRQLLPSKSLPGLWPAFAASLIFLTAVDLPIILTDVGMQMAASDQAQVRSKGIRWLRAIGNSETMLRRCYDPRRGMSDGRDLLTYLFFDRRGVHTEEARNIYYRVHGVAFNSVPAPKLRNNYGGRWSEVEEMFTWDSDQAGQSVAGRVKGLSLAHSRQDGLIDADAALAYVEWTLEFKNVSNLQREARAQISLPPGGVISRLTLWVDGEEREAAFAGRAEVRQAYQSIVSQKRDPVLVTSAGPDRVLMQCFPVPPSGTMKVRLGITAPLAIISQDEAVLKWPCFLERNFTITDELTHSVWLESSHPISARHTTVDQPSSQSARYAVRGSLNESSLADPQSAVRIQRSRENLITWTEDTRHNGTRRIIQRIETVQLSKPKRIVLVVDTSKGMDVYYNDIAEALNAIPPDIELRVLAADDAVVDLSNSVLPNSMESSIKGFKQRLREIDATGGKDNVPALIRAWDLASESSSSAIIWIHGPQPILLESTEDLKQRIQWRERGPELHDVQTFSGPNRIAEVFDGFRSARGLPRFGSLQSDLSRLFAAWSGKIHVFGIVREVADAKAAADGLGKKASFHIARLFAFGEIMQLISSKQTETAVKLAGIYQLVTPVSGAVVLETQAQYQAAGLEPVAPTSVPTVPEPGTWALLIVGGILLGIFNRRRRRTFDQ